MPAANKAGVKRWLEESNRGRSAALAAIDEVVTPDYALHDPSGEPVS